MTLGLGQPATRGIDHLGLAVRNLEATRDFFVDGLGWQVVGERPDYPAVFVADGVARLTLWQVEDPASCTAFDRRRDVGLHHLALKLDNREALEALWPRMAAWPGVEVEFGPSLSGKGSKVHAMLYEPSGNRIELAWDPR